MTNNQFVEKLYTRQSELIRICKYLNMYNKLDIDDIIQLVYIKLLLFKDINKYTVDNEPNMYIVFMIIKNTISDYRKKNVRYDSDNLDIDIIEEEEEPNYKYNKILEEIPKVKYWFNREIIRLYVEYNHSIRSLAKETKIGFNVIQPIIRDFKTICKEKIKSK